VSRGVWKAVEAKVGEIRIVEAKEKNKEEGKKQEEKE